MTYTGIVNTVTNLYPDLDIAGLEKETRDPGNDNWQAHEPAFWASLEYLRRLSVTVTYRRHTPSSYGLKHDVERIGEANGQHVYVPNGVMIAAMIHLNIPFKRDTINATARISPLSRRKQAY